MILKLEKPYIYNSLYHFINEADEVEMQAFRELHQVPDWISKEELQEGHGNGWEILDFVDSDFDAICRVIAKVWKGIYIVKEIEDKYEGLRLFIYEVKMPNSFWKRLKLLFRGKKHEK